MRPLPTWNLTNRFPAFYDIESGSAIEQTAKVYAAMQELIKEYNAYVESVNKEIAEFEKDSNANFDCFKQHIVKITNDFISSVDTKINLLAEAKIENLFNENDIVNRLITLENNQPYYIYNEETEELELKNVPTRSE